MTIIPRTQEALKVYAESRSISGLNVYRGMAQEIAIANADRQATIVNPSLICECRGARHNQDLKGNWLCEAAVILRLNSPDTTEDALRTWCGTMSEHFETTTLAGDINAALDAVYPSDRGYTAIGIELRDAGYRLNGKVWEIFLMMDIHCCPTKIT